MTTLLNKQLAQVIETLKQSATSDLISIYNEYAETNSYESVYDNDELILDDMFTSHYDAIRSAFYGDYNPSHAYFTFNGYGNLQSFEYLGCDNCPIDIEELAQWIVDNDLFNDYDIDVTTLDDMLNSIEDNITDDSDMLYKLADYLNVSKLVEDYLLISGMLDVLGDYSYDQLQDIMIHLDINY